MSTLIDSKHFPIKFLPEGGVVSPLGFLAGSARGEIKSFGDDVALILAVNSATAAAVFTRNLVKAAPVLVCADHLQSAQSRAVIINAGNANCCTGEQGLRDAKKMCELAALKLNCHPREVLVCSTGIIGHALSMGKIESALAQLNVSSDAEQNEKVARAVMTTDTRPKFCAASCQIGGKTVTVGGLIKGVGMIGPDMGPFQPSAPHATLLGVLTTDAVVEKVWLQAELERVVERSLNSVTVDGDTSTNDTAILLASGASDVRVGNGNVENDEQFRALLETVCIHLAREVARDGEGATKIIAISVLGAQSEDDAKSVAMTIANSPLVKTALFGNDPNWGRIAAAAGRSGAHFRAQNLGIKLGAVEVFKNGEPTDFDVAQAEAALKNEEVEIEVSLGEGEHRWTAWTCDFSYDYVKINAEYHT